MTDRYLRERTTTHYSRDHVAQEIAMTMVIIEAPFVVAPHSFRIPRAQVQLINESQCDLARTEIN